MSIKFFSKWPAAVVGMVLSGATSIAFAPAASAGVQAPLAVAGGNGEDFASVAAEQMAPQAQPRIHLAQSIARNRGFFTSSRRDRADERFSRTSPRAAVRRSGRPSFAAPGYRPAAIPRQSRANRPPQRKQRQFNPAFLPTVVPYDGPHSPGTIVIDTPSRYLYLVQTDGTARRYGVGVGRPGFQWAGAHKVTRKAEWPDWRPPAEMRKRQPGLPEFMPGGPHNPLGARALYLGSTLYRIHGSNEPWTIGRAVSSGCIRMRNEDVEDLYTRVDIGTTVVVR